MGILTKVLVTELRLNIVCKADVRKFPKERIVGHDYLVFDGAKNLIASHKTIEEAEAAAHAFYTAWHRFECATPSSELVLDHE